MAETFEFRAISRDLQAPYVQQYNFGVQRELGSNMAIEVRYVGTKGHELLEARAFNQGYDLNDPTTPDYIFERFNQAYVAANSPNGALNAGATAKERGVGRAFGFANTTSVACSTTTWQTPAAASSVSRRGDPSSGSTFPKPSCSTTRAARCITRADQLPAADEPRPAVQHVLHLFPVGGHELGGPWQHGRRRQARRAERGLRRPGDQRNLDANYALSDFDRPHRFSTSFIYELPGFARVSACRASSRCSPAGRTPSLPRNRNRQRCAYADLGPWLRRTLSRSVRPAEPVRLAR